MNKTITLDQDYFEHLLNCLANQKFIHEVNADGLSEGEEKVKDIQSEMQQVIDVAWREGMDLLYETQKETIDKSELIEVLSAYEHQSWSHWMLYLFSKCEKYVGVEGLTIPTELVARWEKQSHTPYKDLSEREKQSDRDEVAKILPIIEVYHGSK